MELYNIKMIETAVVVVVYLIIKALSDRVIDATSDRKMLQRSRGILIKQAVNIVLLSLAGIFIFIVWGVQQKDVTLFIGSVLTVIGVALFAQWSLLSNLTASLIIFFNHPAKIGDKIIIMESKDYQLEGTITNIGLFFVRLVTAEDEEISLPNNVFIMKSIRKANTPLEKTDEDETEKIAE
jgi:small-conductance mechanosensitive channel